MSINKLKTKIKRSDFVILVVLLAATMILLSGLGSRFYSVANFKSMSFQVSEFGFIALAMSLAMLSGGIDLSVVSNAGLAGVICIMFMSGKIVDVSGWSETLTITIGISLALTASTLGGIFNGILIAKLSIPPILATLGTMMLYNGIGMAMTNGASMGNTVRTYTRIGVADIGGIPLILILLLIAFIVVSFVLRNTLFGTRLYLVGDNKTVARFSGINVDRTLIGTYALAGFLVGIAAVIMTSRVNSARMGFGDTYQLQAILVSVMGGINPNGGKGNVLGVGIGIVILQFLQSALTILGGTPYMKQLIWGFLLLLVMITNYLLSQRSKS